MEIGVVNIKLIRGNSSSNTLSFFDDLPDGTQVPMDLSLFDSIKMSIKTNTNVNNPPVDTLTVGDGLSIIGVENNTLNIDFGRGFVTTNANLYYYDILFEKGTLFNTYIKGTIETESVVTI